LGTKKRERDIYKLASQKQREDKGHHQVKCINDELERLQIKEEEIKNRWRKYFNELLNKDCGSSYIELDISANDLNKHFVRKIQEFDVKNALKR
jgi:hypothetical protein